MSETLKVPLDELRRSLIAYAKVSTRTFAELVNQTGYNITTTASKTTRKADYQKMFDEIGPTSTKLLGYKVRITKRRVK